MENDMKRLIWKMLSIAWMGTIIALITISCEKGPNFREFTYPAPVVNDFHPKQGYVGSLITIDGADFGTLKNAVKVYFGDVPADSVNYVEDNKIEVLVPESAISGILTVEIFGKQDQTKEELAILPSARVVLVSTDKAQEGEEVTITGENFGENPELVQVLIGEVEAQVNSVTPTEVRFAVPDAPSGNIILIVDGQRLNAGYLMIGIEKLTGTLIGHSGSWQNNPATMIQAAVDGNLDTYIDAATTSGYVGWDLGVGKAAVLASVRYAPRSTHAARMVGGEIRGANDPSLSDYVVLHKITATPPAGVLTEASIQTEGEESYRYIYYYAPEGNCNIAEIEFYGNIVEKAAAVGHHIWEFTTDGEAEGWEAQQGGVMTVSGGALSVKFPQTSGNKRADLKQTKLPIKIHTGNYPIFAVKMEKPEGARITFDTNNGAFGNGFNKYATDYATEDVYFWDMASLSMGSGPARPNEEISLSTFQLKIADIPQDDPATGYKIEWIRTFESKEKLAEFLGK